MSIEESVSEWLHDLREGEDDAARKLWVRYSGDLVALARAKMARLPRAATDEEDIAQSVFASICRAAQHGRFSEVRSRDELWWSLLLLTKHKVANYVRHETALKRGGGKVRLESDTVAGRSGPMRIRMNDVVCEEASPEFLVALDEEFSGLLKALRDETLRKIAIDRVEGFSVDEIAEKLGIAKRSVERKLQVIRRTWSSRMLSETHDGQ